MNFKTTYVLFGILAVVMAILVYAVFVGPTPDTSAWVLPSVHNEANPLPTKDIDRVEIERDRPDDQKTKIVLVPKARRGRSPSRASIAPTASPSRT